VFSNPFRSFTSKFVDFQSFQSPNSPLSLPSNLLKMVFSQRETVSIHIGQAGIQTANTTWELYCLEHGINKDGTVNKVGDDDSCFHTFFAESSTGKFVPRAILVVSESGKLCGRFLRIGILGHRAECR
jgi:hypothetical protein